MEVTVGPPSVIRSGTGLAGPSRAGAMVVPGAATALAYCLQAVGGVPWLSPGTRHPWSGSPGERISGGALLRGHTGRSPSPRDDTRTHAPLATGGTPLGMALPTLRPHRLPVQTPGDLQRRLPKRRAAGGEGAAAWLGWDSPSARTTRVWGTGTWRSHRCRKAATGQVLRWGEADSASASSCRAREVKVTRSPSYAIRRAFLIGPPRKYRAPGVQRREEA